MFDKDLNVQALEEASFQFGLHEYAFRTNQSVDEAQLDLLAIEYRRTNALIVVVSYLKNAIEMQFSVEQAQQFLDDATAVKLEMVEDIKMKMKEGI